MCTTTTRPLIILQNKIKINSTHTRRQFFYIGFVNGLLSEQTIWGQGWDKSYHTNVMRRCNSASICWKPFSWKVIWELFYFSHWKQIFPKIITNIPLCPVLREAHRSVSLASSPGSCPQCLLTWSHLGFLHLYSWSRETGRTKIPALGFHGLI